MSQFCFICNKPLPSSECVTVDRGMKTLIDANQKLREYEERGPTAKQWIQYFHMASIAKEFIRAEQMGDWQAHLNTVKGMLPYFHASGHFLR